jgi:3-oxoacyl-[acyl-carrier-protein] synthase III
MMNMMRGIKETIRILGTGSHVPSKILTNQDLVAMGLDTSDEWIVKRTGIRERRIASPDVATSDLGYEAAVKALAMAALPPGEIELIISWRPLHRTPAARPRLTGFRRDWMHASL